MATWAQYQNAMKEVWASDTLVSQIAYDNELFARVEKTDKYTLGEYAIVPTLTSRAGGFTVAPNTGSTAFNAAGSVVIGQPQYSLTYQYQPVSIQHAAIVSTGDRAAAVADVIDTETEKAVEELRTQISRQLYGSGDSLITACVTSSSGQAVLGLNATTGQDALLRQWLHPGLVIDLGTTANEVSVDADKVIQSVSKSSTTPTVTLTTNLTNGAGTTTFVSIANGRSGTTSYETNGLKNIVSTSASLGGVAAGGQWQAGAVDTATTDLTLDAMLAVQEGIQQETGKFDVDVLTSFRQMRRFYNLFQNQVRFQSDSQIQAGNTESVKWNGMTVHPQYHCPSTHMFFVNFADLVLCTGSRGIHWTTDITGGNKLEWAQNTTAFVGAVAYPLNLAAKRRISMGALTALT